jgi:hypothetical protein
MSSQVKITAILTARPGKAGDLLALLASMAPQCRAEPGNLHATTQGKSPPWPRSVQPGALAARSGSAVPAATGKSSGLRPPSGRASVPSQ